MDSGQNHFYDRVRNLVQEDGLFETWFSQTTITLDTTGEPVLEVPHDFQRKFIFDRFNDDLNTIAKDIWCRDLRISSQGSIKHKNAPKRISQNKQARPSSHSPKRLYRAPNADFTLEKFYAGESNQLALKACQLVCEKTNESTILVLTGTHGTGKSHLAHGVASAWPAEDCVVIRAEEFANRYIYAAKENRLEQFRTDFRKAHLLILEDLDFFLEGHKLKTITELMQNLKVLHQQGKQILITSRKNTSEYHSVSPELEHFLLTGMRLQLKELKSDDLHAFMEHILQSRAQKLPLPIRRLLKKMAILNPGLLTSTIDHLLTYSKLSNNELGLETARELLSDHYRSNDSLPPNTDDGIDLHRIARVVAKMHGFNISRLLSNSRERHLCQARHVAMFLSHDTFSYTLREIGHFFGGRQHQSVLSGINKVRTRMNQESDYRKWVESLLKELKSS